MKEKTKSRLKVAIGSSPAIAAFTLFPAESFSFLKMMKEAGVELPMIITVATIAWWLRKDVIRIVDGRLGEMNTNMKDLGVEIKATNAQNARQFNEGAKMMQTLAHQVRFIMTYLQIKAPENEHDLTERKP